MQQPLGMPAVRGRPGPGAGEELTGVCHCEVSTVLWSGLTLGAPSRLRPSGPGHGAPRGGRDGGQHTERVQ